MRKVALISFVLLVGGCAGDMPTLPNGGVVSASDYGPRPNDVQGLIAEFLRPVLKDPQSAQVERVTGPSMVMARNSVLGPGFYGWGICFHVNAKNSYGGYVGFKRYVIVVRDGSVVRSYGHSGGAVDDAIANALCQQV